MLANFEKKKFCMIFFPLARDKIDILPRGMNEIKEEEVLDTKIVNDAKYKLILREENGVKMKLWIPDDLLKKKDTTFNRTLQFTKPFLSLEEKVRHLYQQLKNTSNDEKCYVRKQVIVTKCHINFEAECVAWHSAIWRTYKVHIRVEWFKTSRNSIEWALYSE